MDRREAIKTGVAAVAAVAGADAVEAFDKDGDVASIGRNDILILECPQLLRPDHKAELNDVWRRMREDKPGLPNMILLDGGLTLVGVIKGDGHGNL